MSQPSFELDRFQREANAAIDADRNVLVAAPTGAGKTVVADHAVDRALASGRRAFYTTPIKALSNQKFTDLCHRLGTDQVGLLTGDNSIRADAPVVVMTTEVLRNMIYAGSRSLAELGWVILDEVHYLQDRYRGPVWEEVLVHAPAAVRFVCLSATVSNAEELAGWIESARGPTVTVVEHERPVELVNHFLVGDRASGEIVQIDTLVHGRANPDGARFDPAPARTDRRSGSTARARQRWAVPRRGDVVDHLAAGSLLPAIVFVFSRKGCDDAVASVVDVGRRLTTADERDRIRAIVEERTRHLGDDDLRALGYDRWLQALLAGVAAHHAGMVPPFKEAVEGCFVEGLIKVVFATETLALGINMPARSVVIETLSKFTGEHHEELTPSQYTQLTGRAGRRGIDPVGHAFALWSPWYGFDRVAALAASREFVLRSAFVPTPNMVVNLVRRYDRDRAEEMIGRSFAQYQADRSLGRLVNRRARRLELLAEAEEAASCELGDVEEYRRARAKERRAAREARQGARDAARDAFGALRPGDVLRAGGHRLAVLSVSHRKGGVRVRAIDADRRLHVLDDDDLAEPVTVLARIELPEPYDPRNRTFQRHVASSLRKANVSHQLTKAMASEPPGVGSGGRRASALPVAACPDLRRHLDAAAERDRLRRQVDELDRRIGERSSSLGRSFEATEQLLEARGFLDGWSLTERGEVLARIFHESDLLVATAICDGLLDDLSPAELAGVVSTFTYEHRSKEAPPAPWYPSPAVRERSVAIERLARAIADDEDRAGLSPTRRPDPTFLPSAHGWAAGGSFAAVLADEDLSGGDFVRNVKVLIDLLRQVAMVAPAPGTRASAAAAAEALLRGVVAASSEVDPGAEGVAAR